MREPYFFSSSLFRRPTIKDNPATRFRYWKRLMARAARGRLVGVSTGGLDPRPMTGAQYANLMAVKPFDSPEKKARMKAFRKAEATAAAQNLQALPRPLKPPSRKETP